MSISENIKAVEAKVAAAAERSGRKREDILLLAVSKTKPVETIRDRLFLEELWQQGHAPWKVW